MAFAFGVASVPMVGTAIGAGLVTRRRQVAWTAGAAAGLTVGLVGLVVALKPALWVSLFTEDAGVTAAANSYFAWAGPTFVFFGIGASLYFASQGAAKVGGPVLAYTARLAMVAIGLGAAVSVGFTRWGKRSTSGKSADGIRSKER
jgi:Na+-driven multidrug efflux pump